MQSGWDVKSERDELTELGARILSIEHGYTAKQIG